MTVFTNSERDGAEDSGRGLQMFVQSRLRLAPPFLARIPPRIQSKTEARSSPIHPYQSTLYSFSSPFVDSTVSLFPTRSIINPSSDQCIKETNDLF